jgi:F-type H+-transporting ATPase subunit b
MDKLLTPDIGLTVWTVVTFLCVVFILGRFAWKPILAALEAREARIRDDVRSAEESRRAAEAARLEFETRLAGAQSETRALLDRAEKDARLRGEELLKAAREEAARLALKTREELAEEQRRLVSALRGEVVSLAVGAAEKILGKAVDKAVQDKALRDASTELDEWAKKKN